LASDNVSPIKQYRLIVTKGNDMADYEFIDEGDMQFVPRGRKSNVPEALVKAFTTLPKGKACKLTALKVDLKAVNAKTEKARVSAVIRQGAKQAGMAVSIHWAVDGTPQAVRKA
jgi:hypothetical protein